MATFKLSLNVFIEDSPIRGRRAPQARRALQAIGLEARAKWVDLIEQSPSIPQEQKADYVRSLAVETTGPLQVSVYSDWKYAYEVENGRPSRDLKRMLDTSLKVRVSTSKKNAGKRYLIIPFQHTQTSIPAPVHRGENAHEVGSDWDGHATVRHRGLGRHQDEGSGACGPEKVQIGVTVCQRAWRQQAPHHKTDRYAGMVRMNTSAGKGQVVGLSHFPHP